VDFVKTAESVLYDDDGNLLMEDIRDEHGAAIPDPWNGGRALQRPKADPKGFEVYTSTETVEGPTTDVLKSALASFKGRAIQRVDMIADGTVTVRVAKEA
jgi:hypothetical protein